MKSYKEFLSEAAASEEVSIISEATKKQILDFMAKSKWDKNDTYLFGLQATAEGLFKNDNTAAKAFSKYYEEYLKMPHGDAPRPIFKDGKVVMSKGAAAPKKSSGGTSNWDKTLDSLAHKASVEKTISRHM